MKMRLLIILLLALAPIVMVSGCVEQNSIKSQEDVSKAVTNVSKEVSDIDSTLEEIDKAFG